MNCDFMLAEAGELNTFRCRLCEGVARFKTRDPERARRTCPVGSKLTGPGTHLKRIIEWFATETATCKCKERAATMDRWGPDQCEQHISEIAGWLQEEAWARGIPTPAIAFHPMIHLAISRARDEKLLTKNSETLVK